MIEVTFSKQWIHFRRSDLCPPTSTILQRERDTNTCREMLRWTCGECSPKDDILQIERILDDTRRRHTDSKNILLGGQITWYRNSIDTIQIARRENRACRNIVLCATKNCSRTISLNLSIDILFVYRSTVLFLDHSRGFWWLLCKVAQTLSPFHNRLIGRAQHIRARKKQEKEKQ